MAETVLIESERLREVTEELSKIVEANIKIIGIKLRAWRRQSGSVIPLDDFGIKPGTNLVAIVVKNAIVLLKWRE
jgi:hypothetical protein